MAICQKCSANNPDGSTFCSNCGARLLPPNTMFAQPVQPQAAKPGLAQHNGKATASLILGIIGLVVWIVPFIGLPVSIVGIVLGVIGLKSQKPGMATAGLVMSILGLIGTIISAFIGVLAVIPFIDELGYY